MWRWCGGHRMDPMTTQGARAKGIANIAMDGTILDTWYPSPALIDGAGLVPGTVRLGAADIPDSYLKLVMRDDDRLVEQVAVETTIADLQSQAVDAHDVYLRLHLLSHRLVQPGEVNLEDAREHLANVVWTNYGPCAMKDFQMIRGQMAGGAPVTVFSVDKFPRMLDYVVPGEVTVVDSGRVRLGAYLAPGTVVGADAFIDYGAGSLSAVTVNERVCFGETVG